MNNKKTSAIKFSKRPVWQILFAAMIASGLMAVGQGTEEIEGKLAREVSELVKDAAIEVMEEQREVIEEKGGEIVQSRLIKAIEAQIMGELSIGKLFSIEFNNLTLEQTMEELERIRRAESDDIGIDVGASTPAPRARSGHPTFDPVNSIILLNPVPDFRQMAYASMDDTEADAWTLPEAVQLKLPVALASMRDKKVSSFQSCYA